MFKFMRTPSRLFYLQYIVEMTKSLVCIHNVIVLMRQRGAFEDEEDDVEGHCNFGEDVYKVEEVEAEKPSI